MNLKLAVLTAVATVTLAGPAQAAVTHTEDIKLTSTGYDFGGSGWAAGAPTGFGEIHFHYENGTIRPHVLGTLHVNDADGTCSRMKLEFRTITGSVLSTQYGGTVCVFDDAHHAWSVDLDPYSNPEVSSVRVSVQKETATDWYTTASDSYGNDTTEDLLKITEQGVDFGSSGWGIGAPSGDGDVYWDLFEGVATPVLRGAIHLNNSLGECARMNLRYLTEGGTFLAERAGGTVCAADNGHHSWTVHFGSYGSDRVGQVTVQLQTLANNGTYVTAGSKTVSIAE